MLEDMQVHPQDRQLPIEEITSPLEFSESELFPDQNSEIGYEDHPNSYHQTHMNTFNPPNKMKSPPIGNFPFIFDEDENDISASIHFSTSPSFSAHNPYINNNNNTEASLNNHLSMGDMVGAHHERWATGVPLPLSTSNYEEECLPPYIRVGSSQPGIHAPYLAPGIFMMHQELDYQGDNAAIFLPDTIMPGVFNCSTQFQGVSEGQHGGGSSGTTGSVNTSLASEISSLEDATFKVGKISVEERKRKIHRYMKKRNERNFSKKIKYACRKTLADSRPRVRGRFAKNDELMMGNNHEDETDHDDMPLYSNSMPHPPRKVVLKEEEDHDSSEIYAHISSFKYYPIKSWS